MFRIPACDHLLTRDVEWQEGLVAVEKLPWCIDEVVLLKCDLEAVKIAIDNISGQGICSTTLKIIGCAESELRMTLTEASPPVHPRS